MRHRARSRHALAGQPVSRRQVFTTAFLAVTALAVGGELWAALDSSPDTVPWTNLIADNVPWPVTATAIAILITWLPSHFAHAYGRPPMVLTPPDPTVMQPTEPLITRAGVVAGAAAVLACATAFGLDLSPKQTAGVTGVVAVAAPLVAAWWARRTVWSPASVARVVEDTRTAATQTDGRAP
jgi:hypothetical protein